MSLAGAPWKVVTANDDPQFIAHAERLIKTGRQFVLDEQTARELLAHRAVPQGLAVMPFDELAISWPWPWPMLAQSSSALELPACTVAVRIEQNNIVFRVPIVTCGIPNTMIAFTAWLPCDEGGLIEFDGRRLIRSAPKVHGVDSPVMLVGTAAVFIALKLLFAFEHRDVRIVQAPDPNRPPNRQQRRAAGWVDRERYEVRIRPYITVREVLDDLERGKKRRGVTPHDRRAHIRRHPKTKEKTVRVKCARVKGGNIGRYPIYDASGIRIGGAA